MRDTFSTQESTAWGTIMVEVMVCAHAAPNMALCETCARSAIRSGYETMAIALPIHVLDTQQPSIEQDGIAFMADTVSDQDNEEDDDGYLS